MLGVPPRSPGPNPHVVLTFLASPKPFRGVDGDNQRRAIRSWCGVHPNAEVMLFGDAEGVEEVAREVSAHYVPNVQATPRGLPYFNAIVGHAETFARHDVLVYVNSDILLGPDVVRALRLVEQKGWREFLVTGQRVDLAHGATIDAENSAAWLEQIAALAAVGQAELHGPSGMDYFIFRKNMWASLAPVIIGRAGYDNALLAYCLRRKIPTVDGTQVVLAIHQHHDYRHVAGGKRTVFVGDEARQNFELHQLKHSPPDVRDVEWSLLPGELVLSDARGDRVRQLEMHLRFGLGFERLGLVARALWRTLSLLGIRNSRELGLMQVLPGYQEARQATRRADAGGAGL